MIQFNQSSFLIPRNYFSEILKFSQTNLDVQVNQKSYYSSTTLVLKSIINPLISCFGVLSNLLNIVVLCWRYKRRRKDLLEERALLGLIALSLTDFFLCLSILPNAFFDSNKITFKNHCSLACLYRIYGVYIHTLCFKTSTWVTVFIALSWYVVVCQPLHARYLIGLNSTKKILILIFIFWAVLLIPLLWTFNYQISDHSHEFDSGKNQILEFFNHSTSSFLLDSDHFITSFIKQNQKKKIIKNETFILLNNGVFSSHSTLHLPFSSLWFLLGYFLPLIILCFSNFFLIRCLRSCVKMGQCHVSQVERMSRRQVQLKQANYNITFTVVLLIFFFIVLVSPSQILDNLPWFFQEKTEGLSSNLFQKKDQGGFRLHILELLMEVSNTLLLINCSSHIFIYCFMNFNFRKTLLTIFWTGIKKITFRDRSCFSSNQPNTSHLRQNNLVTKETHPPATIPLVYKTNQMRKSLANTSFGSRSSSVDHPFSDKKIFFSKLPSNQRIRGTSSN